MKKTFNINLGGIVFHIDEDAYELLDNYLSNLRIHFSKEEGAEEIVHDMELRISELFSERLNDKNQVITLADVEEIIAQMGKPEEFADDTTQDNNEYTDEKKGVKRLFRNPDNKVLELQPILVGMLLCFAFCSSFSRCPLLAMAHLA